MPADSVRSRTLTIYLIKEGVTAPQGMISGVDTLANHTVRIARGTDGTLYVKPSFANRPHWVSLFDGYINLDGLSNKSTAAVLLVTEQGRTFALTFGYGKHLLIPGSYEEGFGLRVTLSAIRRDSIRAIDKRTFDAISQHTRQQSDRGATTREFGLDVEQDMLQAATGIPDEEALGSRMNGKDALTVTVKTELSSVPTFLRRYLELFTGRRYRQEYSWIDQVDEIRDRPLREALDEQLIAAIRQGHFNKLWLAVPEIIEWRDVAGFKYLLREDADVVDDLHFNDFLDTLRDPAGINVSMLHQRYVHVMSASNDQVMNRWQVYRCIYFETTYNGHTYLLSDARWYRVDRDFIDETNRRFSTIEESPVALPDYNDDSETDYNERVAAQNQTLALMDKQSIQYGGGKSKEEFCDLYSTNREIIHVKRYGQARVLSHLLAQGKVSAELFYTEPLFRRKLNEKLPSTHRLADPEAKPTTSDFNVVFAVVSDAPGALELPFFSRLNFVNAARRIEGYGYNVYLKKIGVAKGT